MRISNSIQPVTGHLNQSPARFTKNEVFDRIINRDHTIWSSSPDEISNRLGWLDISVRLSKDIDGLIDRIQQIRNHSFEHIILLGMGGSSLASDVFRRVFKTDIDFRIIDTTHPDEIKRIQSSINLSKTLFIVATKSGSTSETISLFKYFYNLVAAINTSPGDQFIAITDPDSKLEKTAKELNFLEIFQNDPDIGGRFSVLSYFGMVPAALMGIDIRLLLQRSNKIISQLHDSSSRIREKTIEAGLVLGDLAQNKNINKLTIVSDNTLASFGDWLEQLIAESTGKHGKGILPVILEPGFDFSAPSLDRSFAFLSIGTDKTHEKIWDGQLAKQTVWYNFELDDQYDLGGLMYVWEMITAIAGYILQINPFNQPDVELAKISARTAIENYQSSGKLPEVPLADLNKDTISNFLSNNSEPDYISLHIYAPYNDGLRTQILNLQEWIHTSTGKPATIGFGPRFLHSTGQLHKGDAGKGYFMQFIQTVENDLDIPDEAGSDESSMSFGTLIRAQAIGDRNALAEKSRKVISFESDNLEKSISEIIQY